MKRKISYVLAFLLLLSIPVAGIADNIDKAVSKSVKVSSIHIDEIGSPARREDITAVTLRTTISVYRDANGPTGYVFESYSLVKGPCGVKNSFTGYLASFKVTIYPTELYCVAKWANIGGKYNSTAITPKFGTTNTAYIYSTQISFSNESHEGTKTIK